METVLGRESGDVVFTEDPFLSRRHAAIRALGRDGNLVPAPAASAKPEIAKFALVDLGSSNGTFLRIRNEIELLQGPVPGRPATLPRRHAKPCPLT
jgi:hypothetical protein